MIYVLLLDISLKAAVLFALAWTATLAMRKASAAARHLAWCAAAAAVLALPLLSVVLPAWRVLPGAAEVSVQQVAQPPDRPLPDTARLPAPAPTPSARPLADQGDAVFSFDAGYIIVAGWLAGALACLLPPLIGWSRLRRLARGCERITEPPMLRLIAQASSDLNLRRPIRLLMRDGAVMPMTWGVLRPTVLVPREALDWSHDRLRAVLLHELAHVKRLDCFTHLLGHFARAIYWFNPLAWVAVWRMSVERERACDDLVLHAGMRQSDYARELLAVGATLPPAPRGLAAMAMAMARPSRMERRLCDVLDEERNRRPLTRRKIITAAALVALITLPAACVKSREAEDKRASKSVASLPAPIPTEQMTVCQENLSILVQAAQQFSYENRGYLPPSLGRTLDTIDQAIETQSVPKAGSKTEGVDVVPRKMVHPPRPLAHYYLCDTDPRRTEAPERPTAQWVDQNTLYRYLAHNVVNAIGKYPPATVMIYEDLDWKGHGDTINVGFWDGTVRSMDRATAARAIEASRAHIDAVWAERAADKNVKERVDQYGWTPLLTRSSSYMRHVGLALMLYARDHGNRLPQTLGAALEYGDDELSTAAKARMYLLPRDQHGVTWPSKPTPVWIDRHTSYVYLAENVNLDKLPDDVKVETILFHTKLADPLNHPEHGEVVLTVYIDGHSELVRLERVKPLIEKSRKILDAARGS